MQLILIDGVHHPELSATLPSLKDVIGMDGVSLREMLDKFRSGLLEMAGFVPNEGEAAIGQLTYGRITTDYGADMQLGLFTNVAPGETITEATLTEPTGTGYARKTLTDGSWTGAADVRSYAEQVFTGGAGGWTGSIQGYFIVTNGTTQRITAIEVDSAGPYTIGEDDTYSITPNIATV